MKSNEQQSQLLNNTPGWQSPPGEGQGSASPSSASNSSTVNRSINTVSQADLETLNEGFPSTPRTDTIEHFKPDLQALDDGSSPTPVLSFRAPHRKEEVLASFVWQLGAARHSLLQRCIDSVRATLATDLLTGPANADQPDAQFWEEVDDDAPGDVAKLIRTVAVLDVAAPDARKATFSLWVANPSGKPLLAQEAVVYDAAAEVQSDGEIHLFAADFLSEALETLLAPWVTQKLLRRTRFSNSLSLKVT
ncbi:hypothetical protein CMUS01_08054 [Colletotrichum musicola]|uniref:Uncharacterized protein n=1 Tax=Colletotrichum musicola TaxID=2175873 RepID=A0A8H6NE89_9PEZI|nr:hypothetical protein CMUS01_08054 [Colletotrichum musicola]